MHSFFIRTVHSSVPKLEGILYAFIHTYNDIMEHSCFLQVEYVEPENITKIEH